MSTFHQAESVYSKDLSTRTKQNFRSKAFNRFNWIFLGAALLPMLSIGLFNVVIDPYGVFNSPNFSGLNQARPEKLKNMRLFKAVDITRIKPVTIFLGSSRTEYGLDPNHPALDNAQPAYNLAIGAGTPYELLRYLHHALANQKKLSLVIVNIDEFMFNELNREDSGFSEQRLEKRHLTLPDAINTTLSLSALAASKETIKISRNNPDYQSYSPQGLMHLRPIDKNSEATNYRFSNSIGFYFQVFPRYELSKRYLNDFQRLIKTCKEQGIDVKVYISPSHATRWETIRAAGHWPMYEQMKREVVKITPVWDFSGYNSITTEPISNRMKNYIDDSHYRQEIGDLVLNRILSYQDKKVPDDFGVLLTPDNIESHLAQIRADREVWARNNPDEVKLVEDIKRRHEEQSRP